MSDSNSVKTFHHTKLEILRSMGIPFAVDAFSTLNEKHAVGNSVPPVTGYPTFKYITIGRGGHQYVSAGSGGTVTDIRKHSVTDAVLFESLPFRLVPTNADLSAQVREGFRLRVLETHNGTDYFAYYGRVIDGSAITPVSKIVELENGVITSDIPYVPSSASQNPTPVDLSNTVVNTMQGRHLVCSSTITIDLTTEDIAAILAAAEIIYGDSRFAVISEVGVIAAFDEVITTNIGGIGLTYTELQAAQVMNFVSSEYPLPQVPQSVTLRYGLADTMAMPPVQ